MSSDHYGYGRESATQPLHLPTAAYRVPDAVAVEYPRPWHRRIKVMGPLLLLLGLGVGVALGGGSPILAERANFTAVRPIPTPIPTPTVTVTVTRRVEVQSPAVRRVLRAWTDDGPEPETQWAAMRQLRREWPTLAEALEAATNVPVPR